MSPRVASALSIMIVGFFAASVVVVVAAAASDVAAHYDFETLAGALKFVVAVGPLVVLGLAVLAAILDDEQKQKEAAEAAAAEKAAKRTE